MDNYDLLYHVLSEEKPVSAPVSIRQAVKAMIFGLVALTIAEIPFFGIWVVPPFAIIALCMGKNFKLRFPGHASGFLKAAKISAIVSLPLSVVTTLFYVFYFLCIDNTVSYLC